MKKIKKKQQPIKTALKMKNLKTIQEAFALCGKVLKVIYGIPSVIFNKISKTLYGGKSGIVPDETKW